MLLIHSLQVRVLPAEHTNPRNTWGFRLWARFRIGGGASPPASDRYCPERGVTRGEIRAFLVRALGLTDVGAGDLFTDDDGSVFHGATPRSTISSAPTST